MAEGVSRISIGVIDPEKDTLGIVTKSKELAERIVQEVGNLTDTASLGNAVSQVTTQTVEFILDMASTALKEKEIETLLEEKLKGTGYQAEQIQASIETVRNAIKGLPLVSNEMLALTYGDVKKIIAASIPFSK